MSDESKTTEHKTKPYAELVETILSKLEFYLSSHMANFFQKADQILFDAGNTAGSIDEQNRLLEFMNAVRAQKTLIEKSFLREMNIFLRPISVSKELPKKKQFKESENQLGLIGQDEMEEMVALSGISNKAASEFHEEISHLCARLEHLGLMNDDIFNAQALHPRVLCDVIKETFRVQEFPVENKLILYKVFNSEVIWPIKKLYDELNELMITERILPQIELSQKIKRTPSADYDHQDEEPVEEESQTGAARSARHSGGRAAGRTAGGVSGSGGAGGAAGGASGQGGTGGAAGGASGPGGTGGAAAGGASGPGGAGGAAAGGASGPGGAGGEGSGAHGGGAENTGAAAPLESIPVPQIRQSINDFVGGDPSNADASLPAGGGGFYTRQDVVGALSNLQSATVVSHDAKMEFDAAAIKKAVLTSIADKHGGVLDKRVNQVSEKTIDFIKLIFDAIIADASITDAIKALLLSLQIPVIKAAMIDADFFVDDNHPARQLLDKLAEAGVGVSDHKDLVYIEIEKIVRKLLNDYDEDVAAFSVALEELNQITEELVSKAQEREAEAQRRFKHDHARNVVLQEIRKITLGHELPAGVHALVLKVWPSLMFNHFLRSGKANDEWVEMLMILDKIIDSVQPLTNTVELKALGMDYEDIIKATENKLKTSKRTEAQIKEVIGGLRATYEDLMATPDLPDVVEVEEAPAEEVVSEPESQVSNPSVEIANEGKSAEAEILDVSEDESALEAFEVSEDKSAAEALEVSGDESVTEPIQDLEPEPEEDTPERIAQRKVDALPEDVKPGAWFIVYNGEDKPVRRLKLAVILIQTATLMFVDHLGNIVIEKDAEDFTEELRQDLSGIIMQHSVFDHALNSALKTINE